MSLFCFRLQAVATVLFAGILLTPFFAEAQVTTADLGLTISYRCFGSIDGGGFTHPIFEGQKQLSRCVESNGTVSYATGCNIQDAGIVGDLNGGGHIAIVAKFNNLTRSTANLCLAMAAVVDAGGNSYLNGGTGSGVIGPDYYSCNSNALSISLGRRAFLSAAGGSGIAYCDYVIDRGF